jgi:hypothetical protein
MIEYTQTNLFPGNCWQTAIACVLEVSPETLPDQSVCDLWNKSDPEESGTWTRKEPFYQNEIGAYLRRHHNLAYVSIQPYMLHCLEVKTPGIHFMSGKTVRTQMLKTNHVVVARHGELLWDPHPSRAGLTEVIYWSFLVPYPEEWSKNSIKINDCHCPACGGYAMRRIA